MKLAMWLIFLGVLSANVSAQFPVAEAENAALWSSSLPLVTELDLMSEESRKFKQAAPNHSDRHFKKGTHSLRWAWNQTSAILRMHAPLTYRPSGRDGGSFDLSTTFLLWIYNEHAVPEGRIDVSFRRATETQIDCGFEFGLNFSGWRLIAYDFDSMDGTPRGDMDTIEITSNLSRGILFFDDLRPAVRVDSRFIWPDYQTPFFAQKKPEILNQLHINSDAMVALAKQPLRADQKEQIEEITERVMDTVVIPPFNEKELQSVEGYFDKLDIVVDERSIRGAPIEGKNLTAFLDMYLRLARLCRTVPVAKKPALTQRFLDASRHLLDQGWAEGSALGAQHHFGYKSRAMAPAIMLMRDELREAGLLDDLNMAQLWFGREFFDFTAPYEILSTGTKAWLGQTMADYMNTFSHAHLFNLLLLEDNQAKTVYLRQYVGLIESLLTMENGAIKPDGSFFHHSMHYAGYSLPAMDSICRLFPLLDGTDFEIPRAGYDVLKKAVWMSYIWGYPAYGFNACGRHPMGGLLQATEFIQALAQSIPATNAVDPELANIVAVMGGNRLLSNQPLVRPQGYWAMNFNASGILKYGDFSVISKGYNECGVRSHETYAGANRYGRYASHGTLTIFKTGAPGLSGYSMPGWDWSRPPGSTTLRLPLDVLEGDQSFYGWGPPQHAPFSGAIDLGQEVGAFAFQLDRQAQAHDQSLKVRKSVFAVDNLLVCLGSGLSASSESFPLVTTLSQYGLQEALQAPIYEWIDRPIESDWEIDEEWSGENFPTWFIDPLGVGYYLPAGNDSLRVSLGEQISKHSSSKYETSGRFFTAWLRHGIKRRDAEYEYALLLDASKEKMGIFQGATPPYKVIHRSDKGHAVLFPKRNITGYVFFSQPEDRTGKPIERSMGFIGVDRPALVLLEREADFITLSISHPCPEIRRPYDQSATPIDVHLRINARVELVASERKAEIVEMKGQSTLLRVSTVDGFPTELQLKSLDAGSTNQ